MEGLNSCPLHRFLKWPFTGIPIELFRSKELKSKITPNSQIIWIERDSRPPCSEVFPTASS